MDVKTAELKNNLSKYLRRVKAGETVIVYDRDTPIATLSPIVRTDDEEWTRYREEALARARDIGLKIHIPEKRPTKPCMKAASPSIAPDGRTDINTIDLVRGGRDW
ncbi:MAG: type II toxin-antitoxin system prevent-host-death family antitoxin [Opitutaceae bacterium]|nr:type II toxin-antitoxin system prevent-host-death family antitoxin [Opitutaceae bacterium]